MTVTADCLRMFRWIVRWNVHGCSIGHERNVRKDSFPCQNRGFPCAYSCCSYLSVSPSIISQLWLAYVQHQIFHGLSYVVFLDYQQTCPRIVQRTFHRTVQRPSFFNLDGAEYELCLSVNEIIAPDVVELGLHTEHTIRQLGHAIEQI